MKVFTYYQRTPQINATEEVMLILKWAASWAKIGAEPIVLNEYHATIIPPKATVDSFLEAWAKLPSINPQGYDLTCYVRWLAMAFNPFAGDKDTMLMTDYDVMGYDLTPFKRYARQKAKLVFFQNHVPSCVLGTKQAFLRQAVRFKEYQLRPTDVHEGKVHISDQNIMAHQLTDDPESVDSMNIIRSYGEEGWEQAPAVHYCNASMGPLKLTPRYKYVEALRK